MINIFPVGPTNQNCSFVQKPSPDGELWEAHLEAKNDLIQYVKKSAGIDINVDVLTIGFARRFTSYKELI